MQAADIKPATDSIADYTPPIMQSVRPGSADALKLPSLSTGKHYRPPVAMCVGVSKFTGNAK